MTGLSFFEVMRGELVDRWGRRHLADFEIKAEAPSLRRFARNGHTRITGVVSAEPWTCSAPLQGGLSISPLRGREIVYEFSFRDEQERVYNFRGRKALSWWKPVKSMTHLTATLSCEGEHVAQGEMSFDLNGVLSFFASWWPSSSLRPSAAPEHNDADEPNKLSQTEKELFAALAQAAVPQGRRVPPVDARTIDGAIEHLLGSPASVLSGHRLGLRGLDAAAIASTGRGFASLDLEARRSLLERVATANKPGTILPGSVLPGLALLGLTLPIRAAHFQRADYLRSIGHPKSPLSMVPEPAPRHFQRVIEPEGLEAVTEVHAEVAVVGTGAGGAALAAALAEKGVAVALIEEGRHRRRHDFVGSPAKRIRQLWRDGGMFMALGTPLMMPVGKMVGGTTAINSGTCFETPDHVLEQWRDELGFPSDFAPAQYGRYSAQVRQTLQVALGDPKALGKIANVIGRGADAMGIAHGALPRNAPGCPGAGQCIIGCPEGAKRSTEISYIPAALRAGAELYVGLPMTRILKRGRRVVAIEARGRDAKGERKTVRVHAQRFVLACGSLMSPVVLADNGFSLPRLGRNLSVHPALGLVARCPENLEPWNAIPQGYALHGFEEHAIRYEGYYLPPQMLAGSMPLHGAELTRWMDDFHHLAQFGFMVRDKGDGWVRRGRGGRPVIGYRLSEASQARLRFGAALLCELFLAAGASEIMTSIATRPVVRSVAQAKALTEMSTSRMDFLLLGAHPLGTCAMASSPDKGVVDFNHRVFGTDNLHVVDGSTVPTSLGVNPQMTIMAMALRAADLIEAAL